MIKYFKKLTFDSEIIPNQFFVRGEALDQSRDVENSLQNRLQSDHRKNAPLFQISEFIQGFKIYKIIVKIWKNDTKTDLF